MLFCRVLLQGGQRSSEREIDAAIDRVGPLSHSSSWIERLRRAPSGIWPGNTARMFLANRQLHQ